MLKQQVPKMLDAVASVFQSDDDEADLVSAILSVFIDIDGADVVPSLEVIRDAMFMVNMSWDDMTEEDENNIDHLILCAKEDSAKAEALAKILDAVSGNITTNEDNGLMNAILSVFDDIEPTKVAPSLEVIRDAMFMTSADSWTSDISDEDRDSLDALIASAKDNTAKAEVLAVILDAVSEEFASNDSADLTEELMQSIFASFNGVTKNDVVPTLEVVRDVLFMLDDENALAAFSSDAASLSDIFAKKDESGENLVNRITAKLNSQDRTKPIVSKVTKMSISVMAEKSKEEGGESLNVTEETYENVASGVKDIVSINQNHNSENIEKGTVEYDNYVSDVSDALSDTFVQNGFEVEKNVVDDMAEYVADNYKNNMDELTDDEVNSIILNYYSAYLQSGTLPTP